MTKKKSESISVILPVYNEINLVETAVNRCIQVLSRDFADFELILVDDGSTDGTGDIMKKLSKNDERIRVLHNIINLNVGISIQRAVAIATKDFIVHNAIDLPLATEDIAGLIKHIKDCDVLVLERKTYGGYTLWRWITSKINRILLQMFFGYRGIRDMNFTQIYRRNIIPKILPLAKSPAFTTPEMILRAKRMGLCIKSIAVDYHQRPAGKYALGKPYDILWSIFDMLRFRLKVWSKLSPRKYE